MSELNKLPSGSKNIAERKPTNTMESSTRLPEIFGNAYFLVPFYSRCPLIECSILRLMIVGFEVMFTVFAILLGC